jgi:hypothetical protein
VEQFDTNDKANKDLASLRRFEQAGGKPALPTLPSFPDSMIKLPSAEGASQTIEATVQHNNIVFSVEHMMPDGQTTEATLPKIDAFAKLIATRLDDKAASTKNSTLDGHATMIGKPFINTCTNLGLTIAAQKLGDLQLRPDEVTHSGQYGALSGSNAAGDGVLSSCRLTFGTAAEKTKRDASSSEKSSSTTLSTSSRALYPHTLLLSTNRYASAADAKAALTAKRERQHRNIPDIRDVQIGDGGYKLHQETPIPDFTNKGDAHTIVEDAYTIQSGPNLVVISLQQNHDQDTTPVEVTDARIQDVYQLFKTMLAK